MACDLAATHARGLDGIRKIRSLGAHEAKLDGIEPETKRRSQDGVVEHRDPMRARRAVGSSNWPL